MHAVNAITLAGLTLLALNTAHAIELNDQFALTVTPMLTSDYRSSGISQTLGDPAAQLDVMLSHVSGAYLGVEAEIGKEGIKKVVETPLTDAEKVLLVEAYEAVKAKQADVSAL